MEIKSWRPEGWKCIKKDIQNKAPRRYDLIQVLKEQEETGKSQLNVLLDALIEETADAMLEALRKGSYETMAVDPVSNKYISGKDVFIPDDK